MPWSGNSSFPTTPPAYHKEDQAIFNCLLLKAAAEGALTLTVEEVDISSASPAKDVTTRNIVNPRRSDMG